MGSTHPDRPWARSPELVLPAPGRRGSSVTVASTAGGKRTDASAELCSLRAGGAGQAPSLGWQGRAGGEAQRLL